MNSNGLAACRLRVANCPVDALSFDQAVGEICRRMRVRQKTHIVFINAAKVVKYRSHPDLAAVVDGADLLLADGVPVVWASRLAGAPLPGRVNGTDLMERMVECCAELGFRVFFFGATQDVVAKTVEEFKRRHPQLQVAGFRNGYYRPEEEAAIVDQINQCHPDLLLLAMGTPQKELWAHRHLESLDVAVCEGVGGSFDVVAGVTRRAPRWMQVTGLEWFYRFLQEPRRMWRRYLVTNSMFVWLALVDAVRSRCVGVQPNNTDVNHATRTS
ncbi:MAG TPA: WecB/TagA/CpsF family glycosyltransferase [Terriglobales bacterium]|nr:WecB/TagA/CpsF family glycosyltransferase [Terriglobales bacterium]